MTAKPVEWKQRNAAATQARIICDSAIVSPAAAAAPKPAPLGICKKCGMDLVPCCPICSTPLPLNWQAAEQGYMLVPNTGAWGPLAESTAAPQAEPRHAEGPKGDIVGNRAPAAVPEPGGGMPEERFGARKEWSLPEYLRLVADKYQPNPDGLSHHEGAYHLRKAASRIDALHAHAEQLQSRVRELERELNTLLTAGIIEVSVRNPSVADYCKHWENRTEQAEARLREAEKDATRFIIYFSRRGMGNEMRLTEGSLSLDEWRKVIDVLAAQGEQKEKP